MPRVALPIASGFFVSESPPFNDKRIVNMRVSVSDSAEQTALFQTPGIKQFSDVGAGNSRGVIVFFDGVPYRVIGNSLYSFDEFGLSINHGTILGTKDVSIASNGINIAIQDPGGNSYFFTPSTNVLELNNGSAFLSFGQAETVTFKDGFYVYTTAEKFFSSSPKTENDGKNFNALDFSDAEISPDKIIKSHNNHNQLYILGENTIEVFQTIATSGFPFQRISNAVIQKGCTAPNTVVDFDNGFLFMGGDLGEMPGIWKAVGSSFVKISTSSVDQLMHKNDSDTLRASKVWTYSENGAYYAIFTVGDSTFVYDATASKLLGSPQWHQRQSGIGNGDNFFKWRAVHGTIAFGKVQVGDDRSGLVGLLDNNICTEYGSKIERIISTKPFIEKGEYIFSQEIELFMETGVGNAEVADPQIRMDYSDDGSKTFSSEISKSMGKVGEYNTRVRWSRLGRIPKSRMFRFKTTEAVNVNIYGLYANAEIVNSG